MLKDESWTYAWDYDENESHIILNSENEPIGEVYETQEGVEIASCRAELMADAPTMIRLLDFCAEVAWRYVHCGDGDEPLELLSAFELVRKHKLWIKGEVDAKG